jgi:hypothetical protein
MRTISALILVTFSLSAIAKNGPEPVPSTRVEVGVRASDGKSIPATRFDLEYKVFKMVPGADDHSIILVTKKSGTKGLLCNLNFKDAQYDWSLGIQNFNMRFGKDVIAYNNSNGTYFFSKATGDKLAERPKLPGYVDEPRNLMMAPGLEAINMLTGEVSWKSKVDGRAGWNDVLRINDSITCIAASGVHCINLNTGAGWHYSLTTSRVDKGVGARPMLGVNMFGIMVPLNYSATGPEGVWGMASNLLYDSLAHRIYFSAADDLVCLDEYGKLQWSFTFAKDKASNARLFRAGDQIIMLNSGMAFFEDERVRKGDPFLLSINKDNGKLKYLNIFAKNEYIHGHSYQNDTLTVLCYRELYKFRVSDGSTIASGKLNAEELRIDGNINDHPEYYRAAEDGSYRSLSETGGYNYLVNTNKTAFRLNDRMEIVDSISSGKLFKKLTGHGDYEVLQSSATTVITRNGNPVATLSVSGQTLITGDRLLVGAADKLYVIDLKGLL